jgi:hypothetical protein
VRPVPRLFSSLVHDSEAKGPRRIELEVIGARNLPKMDVMGGTCDAYVKVQYGTRPEFTTSTVKASYSPEWNEKTTLEHEDVLEMTLRAGHSSEEVRFDPPQVVHGSIATNKLRQCESQIINRHDPAMECSAKGFFLTVASFFLVLQGDLLFTVWDWDVATSHDKVGDFTISRQDMAKLWLAEDGSGKEIQA